MSICSNCGNNLSPDSIFCNKCGTKIVKEIFCSKCGNILTSDSNFCNKCGTKVTSKLDCENTFTGNSTVTNNPFTNINAQPKNPFNDIQQPTKANLPSWSWNNPFNLVTGIKVDREKCIGCGCCVETCPVEVLELKGGKVVYKGDGCIECGSCVGCCPVEALDL